MFTPNFNESNALVEGFYLVLLAAMAIVASLSILFALGAIVCAALDCTVKVKQPAHRRAKSVNQTLAVKATR
ncbi:MAG: hypothetical protein AAB401_13555 [Acidobacteriota bacterium]